MGSSSLLHRIALHNLNININMNMNMNMIGCFWFVVAILVCLQEGRDVRATATPTATPTSTFRNHLPNEHRWFRFWNRKATTNFQLQHSYFAIRHGQSKANVQSIIASDPTIATQRFGLSKTGKKQARAAGKQLVQDFVQAQQQQQQNSKNKRPSGIVIVMSDFLRAVETAQELANAILEHNRTVKSPKDQIRLFRKHKNDWCPVHSNGRRRFRRNKHNSEDVLLQMDVRLRERFFGDYDGKSDVHYQDVWKEDVLDPHQTCWGVESVWSVLDRASSVVKDCEQATSSGTTNTTENEPPTVLWIVLVAHGDVLQILQTGFTKDMDPKDHRSLPHLETATLRPLH